MGQVLRATGTEDYASAERSASGQIPHPRLALSSGPELVDGSEVEGPVLSKVEGPVLHRSQSDAGATDAPSRGIESPVSE